MTSLGFGNLDLHSFEFPDPILGNNTGGLPSNLPGINVRNHVTTTLTTIEDFLAWRTQFVAVLIMHQLQGFIDGSLPQPAPYIIDFNGIQRPNPQHATWIRLDQYIRSWIYATLSRGLLTEVHTIVHASQIWSQLSARFNTKCLSRVVELKRTLTTTTKSKTQTVEDYVHEIKTIADNLAAIQHPITDLDLVQYIISGLPSDFEPLVTVITYLPGTITFDDLCTKLIFHEQRVKFLRERESN